MAKKIKSIIILFTIILFIIPFISAQFTYDAGEVESIGTFRQDNCVVLIQNCANCTSINISSVSYPNSTKALNEIQMTKDGNYYNASFCETSSIGTYNLNGVGNPNGENDVFAYTFEITPSGFRGVSSGEGMSMMISIIVILLVSVFFFVMSFRLNSPFGKFTTLVISGIFLFISVLFSMVTIDQTVGGFGNIVSGYATFLTVVKVIVSISILALAILSIAVSVRYYKFRRGWID